MYIDPRYEQLERQYNQLQESNIKLKVENERIKDDMLRIQDINRQRMKTAEDRVLKNQLYLRELENEHKKSMEDERNNQMIRVRDVIEIQEKRMNRKQDSINDNENRIRELELQLNRTNDEIGYIKKNIDQERLLANQVVQDSEITKHSSQLTSMEYEVHAQDRNIEILKRKNEEIVMEFDIKHRKLEEQIKLCDRERDRLRREHFKLKEELSLIQGVLDKLKGDSVARDGLVAKLQSEKLEIEGAIAQRAQIAADQVEGIRRDFDIEREAWESERNNQLLKIQDSEVQLKDKQNEIIRLKKEFNDLCERVKYVSQKALFEVFEEYYSIKAPF